MGRVNPVTRHKLILEGSTAASALHGRVNAAFTWRMMFPILYCHFLYPYGSDVKERPLLQQWQS